MLPSQTHRIMALIVQCRAMSLPGRILLGLGAAVLAAFIRVEFLTGLLGDRNPYVTFVATVPLVAVFAGFTAAATTIVLGALLAHLLVRWPVATTDYILLGIFVVSSGIIAALAEMLHRLYGDAQRTAVDAARVQDYSTFITQAPVAIAMFDRDMRYLAASQLWIELFSPSRPDVVGCSHYDLFPNLPPHWIEAHRRGVAGESVGQQLDSVDTPPFGKRWYRWKVKPWTYPNGAIGGITLFVEDVTERVENDVAIRRSESRRRGFFDNIGVGAMLIEPDGRFLEVNDRFCQITGFSREELIAEQTVANLTYEADRATDQAMLTSYFAGERPHFENEKRYRRKDGSLLWVRVTAAPIGDEHGRIVQAASIVEDISKWKAAEEALRKSEERMALAFQATQDGIWDWDMQTGEVFYSPRWKAMLGYDDAEIEPHVSAWKRLVHPDDMAPSLEKMEKGLLGIDQYEMEFRLRHKDGHYVHVLSRGLPLRAGPEGQIVRIVGTHFDLTERRQRERLLRESEERLTLALEAAEAGVWEIYPASGEFKASDRALELHGVAPGTPMTMALAASVVRPEDRPRADAAIATTMQTGEPLRAELGLPQPDGSTRWLLYRAARFDGPAGPRLIGVVQDITHRKLAIEALERSRNMLAEAEKIAHLGSFEYITATGQTVWSEEEYKIHGLGPAGPSPTYDAFLKHHVHPEDAVVLDEAHRKALRDRSVLESEHRIIRPDGSERWVFSRARPDVDEHGRVVRYIGTTQDITDRKKAVLALSASEERLRLALSAGHMAVWDWDVSSGEVLWNDEHYTMLGYQPGSITPSYSAWAYRVHPEDLGRIEALIQQSLATGTPYNSEFRVLGAEDRTIWLEAHGRVEHNEQAKARRFYGVMIDITARKQADDHKALLLQEVNHRAKNLLSVVQSIAQLTSLDATPEQFYDDFASRLRGLASSHDLLVSSEWTGVDMRDLVHSQLPHYRTLIGHRILLEGPPITLKPAAAQAIGMAIHELGTNAAKHGALSTPEGIVRLSWRSEPKTSNSEPNVIVEWREEGGPAVTPPTRRGFGYTVLVEMPEHLLNASVVLDYTRAGVVWQLVIPQDRTAVQ